MLHWPGDIGNPPDARWRIAPSKLYDDRQPPAISDNPPLLRFAGAAVSDAVFNSQPLDKRSSPTALFWPKPSSRGNLCPSRHVTIRKTGNDFRWRHRRRQAASDRQLLKCCDPIPQRANRSPCKYNHCLHQHCILLLEGRTVGRINESCAAIFYLRTPDQAYPAPADLLAAQPRLQVRCANISASPINRYCAQYQRH